MKKLFLAATLTVWAAVPAFAQQYFPPFMEPPDVVVYGNQVVGQDPDPNVRLDLRRNAECYLHGCGGE